MEKKYSFSGSVTWSIYVINSNDAILSNILVLFACQVSVWYNISIPQMVEFIIDNKGTQELWGTVFKTILILKLHWIWPRTD